MKSIATFPENIEPVTVREEILNSVFSSDQDVVLAVVTATKPDFYKQWSLIPAAEKYDFPHFVIHTGQHHDEILGYGLKEFGIENKIAVNFNIRGDLLQKSYELIAKAGWLSRYLKKNYPKKTVIPIVHGDTLVAGMFPIGWTFGINELVAQNESGLRSMAPDTDYRRIAREMDFEGFIHDQWYGPWRLLRNEPFPEQWDTFVSGAFSQFHFAPHEINVQHLKSEGYQDDTIFLVGNSIVDAIELKRREKPEESVFDVYPQLEEGDDWIRVDIHRRGNLLEGRFKAIIGAVKDLVKDGYNVVFIEMTATRAALEHYNLRDELIKLAEDHRNFLFTGLWPSYGHVIEFLESGKCFAEYTDSGSMQEELNEIDETMCLTARFNTDRPETAFDAKTNILVPPISRDFIHGFIKHIHSDKENLSESNKKLYGEKVGELIVKTFMKLIEDQTLRTFDWSHEVLDFSFDKGDYRFL